GKGSVQTIIPLQGAGAIRLTTARYYTPSGRSIQALGIVPDIEVQQARIEVIENGAGRSEADLRGALDGGLREVPETFPESEPIGEPIEENDPTDEETEADEQPAVPAEDAAITADTPEPIDYQLARAIDLLRGLALFSAQAAE